MPSMLYTCCRHSSVSEQGAWREGHKESEHVCFQMKGAKGEVFTPFAVSAGILTSWPSTRLASPVESSFPPKPAQRHRTCCRTTCFLGLAILCQLAQTVREELQALVLYLHPNGMENRAEKRANKISVPFCDHSAHP